jgi:hypothetical protein
MGIMQDMEKLGLKLDAEDEANVKLMMEEIKKEKEDEFVRSALTEMMVSEFISVARPDIMEALIKERERESAGWLREMKQNLKEE